ncbi:uncharacterized protein LOC141535999 [Cotesia typhae]|uniref:uncharacterized protein LOC141535999 n=1 Tax=Cotesia typhae TaxID=2053667 RepID=UPI003D688577
MDINTNSDGSKDFYNKLLNATLKLYGTSSIAFNQVDYIFDMIQTLFKLEHTNIKNTLQRNADNDKSKQISSNVLSIYNSSENSLKQFNTEYHRLQVLQKNKSYIPPIEFFIGSRCATLKRDSEGNLKSRPKTVTGLLFPLRAMFKKVFELPGIYESVQHYKQELEKNKNIVTNYIQSINWQKKIANFPSKNDVLPLLLFSDDYETGNCLGSHADSNKLCGTYVSIACFPPHLQSLNSIFHALIYYSKDRQEYGNFAVFRTLIQELQFLETTGVEINLRNNVKRTIYFKLGLILGDNLGLHSILGLVENFNSSYSCRFCKMDSVQRSLATLEDPRLIRDNNSYDTDVSLKDPSSTGIKQNCIFNRLSSFHIFDNVVVDIMHDFIEGVMHRDMHDILNYYINTVKLFSLVELTHRIKLYDFGEFDIRNKPPEILVSHLKCGSLKMSAGEMLTFVRHFGIIMGHLIPDEDIVYRLYLNILEILDIILSRSVHKQCRGLLTSLVSEHHLLSSSIFKRKFKTKEHNMIHYDTVMHESGPLINFSGMRWEAKHKESRLLASVSNS